MGYKVNETILYGSHGVCKIEEISERKFNNKTLEYYELRPVYDEKAVLFVPVNNEKLVSKMRPVLSAAEIYALIRSMPDEDMSWIDNDGARKEKFKEILASGDRAQLIRVIKTLNRHQEAQKEKGKKLHIVDERFMKDAEKMLHAEFAYVLDIKYEDVIPFIVEELKVAEE